MSFFLQHWDEPVNDEGGFEKARWRMVELQLRSRGIHEPVVLEAMGTVPREEFVPENTRRRAYCDGAMPIGCDQTISQPYMVALMTQKLLIPSVAEGKKFHRVLEVGGGCGYQAAVLSYIAEEVFTIERIPELAENARSTLARLGYDNVVVIEGDGTIGFPDQAPFNAILVAAAAPEIPRALRDQLALGGKLVIPVGSRGLQELATLHLTKSGFREERSTRCVFVPLLGQQGWKSEEW